MIRMPKPCGPVCSRRGLLRVGGLGLGRLGLAPLLRAAEGRRAGPAAPPRATACILFYLQGGQSQIETFDMKPAAPDQVRGEFRPIRTTVPGTLVCEHLPRLAGLAHRFALVRSMTHHLSNHNPAGYYMLTGVPPLTGDAFDVRPAAGDQPGVGAAVARFRPGCEAGLPFVQLAPSIVGDLAIPMPGQGAGLLGSAFEPLKISADANAAEL